METRNNKILGASLSLVAFSFGFASQAYAQTCKVHPTCEGLGYINTADQCKDGEMVKCPFDASKVFCRKVDKPLIETCKNIGDILYSDMSCSSVTEAIDSNKTAIGIVTLPKAKIAIALQEEKMMYWGTGGNIPEVPAFTIENKAKYDFNGFAHTQNLVLNDNAQYKKPAVEYCYNYTTEGTSKGDWYLPAIGELRLLLEDKENVEILNKSLAKVNGTLITDDAIYWSSSLGGKNREYVWYYDASLNFFGTSDKNNVQFDVRPFLDFNTSCPIKTCDDYKQTFCSKDGGTADCDVCIEINADCSIGKTKYK